jgi:hypothetical protein
MEGAEAVLNTMDEAPDNQHHEDRHVRGQQRGGHACGLPHAADGHRAEPGQNDQRRCPDVCKAPNNSNIKPVVPTLSQETTQGVYN